MDAVAESAERRMIMLKKAGLHPMQIVFSGVDVARACGDRYVNKNNEVCYF